MNDWALQTDGLKYAYGQRRVLDDVSLRVPVGHVYGFLGENGAGKTTTLRLLMGMLKPGSGAIQLMHERVPQVSAKMRRHIGYVSQEQHFYDWMTVQQTARFVAGFYPTWSDISFRALTDRMSIDPAQRVRELSGGTKMKLALVLALSHHPPLLLLDEPTAGLDPIVRREVLELLRDAAKNDGRTVLFSTHHISEVETVGDWVGILHQGRLFYQGPIHALTSWVRRGPKPLSESVYLLHETETDAMGWAAPETWDALHGPYAPVSLDDAFFAITRTRR